MSNKKRETGSIVVPVNTLATATSGLQPDAGNLMPPAIHGGMCESDDGMVKKGSSVKKESSIDFPVSSGLCKDVWDDVGDSWTIKPEIKDKALKMANLLLQHYKVKAKGVNVVGSICSNQYRDDSDIDVHILLDLPQESVDALNNIRKLEQERLFGGMDLMVGGTTHPLEFYFQSNIYSDMGSCGCYDLINDTWLSKPQLVDLEFDPYEEYEQSWNEAFEFGLRVQTALFELSKNLYKHSSILEQASNKDIYSDSGLMGLVEHRLQKVKDDIVQNMAVVSELKTEMVQVRRRAGLNPKNKEEAEKMRTDKEWLSANSTFKFLQRLKVIDSCWMISELYKEISVEDSDIDYAICQLHQFLD